MAQFSVFQNLGRNTAVPFVVQVQSDRLARSLGRVIVPLALHGRDGPGDHSLTPHMLVQGRLVDPVETLAEADQDRIARAMDEMLSRA